MKVNEFRKTVVCRKMSDGALLFYLRLALIRNERFEHVL